MTQQDETSRNDYIGNSSTTEFVYEFKILDRTHIQVVLIENSTQVENIQAIDTDYDVEGVLDDGGGTVTFFTAPDSIFSIILRREVPFNQQSTFVEGVPFPAKTIETNYDKLTQIAQELRNVQRSSLKPPLLPNFTDGTLKPGSNPQINAGDILQVNDDVDGFVANPGSIVFETDGLNAHQIVQLGNIADTTFISSGNWDFLGNTNQGVSTSDDVIFNSVNGATNLDDIAGLTTDEIDQLKNIDNNIISNDIWGNLASMDQDVDTSSSPEFAGLTIGGEPVGASSIHSNQNLSSGSIEDASLSIASATTFDVSSGSGIIVDYSTDVLDPSVTEVSWTAFIGVTLLNIGVGAFKSVAIDSSGDLIQTDDGFTELELRDLIPIGTLVHNATDILFVNDSPRKTIGRTDVVTDLITTLGVLNRQGNLYTANGVNLSLDKSTGETFGLSVNADTSQKFANITTDPAVVLTDMTPIFRDGLGGFTFSAPVSVIDAANFDDGSGVLQSLGVNQATNHRIAFSANSGITFFLYGQTSYANLTAAIDAFPDPFELVSVSNATLSVRANISARGGATDLTDIADAVITEITMFGGAGGAGGGAIQAASLQTAYNQDESIVLAAATPISVQVDTDTDIVVSYKDSVGTEKYSVDGLGNINTLGTDTVTGNPGQGAIPLRISQDDSLNPIQTVFEDKTQFDKHIEINNSDDDKIPVDVIASPSPNTFLLRFRDNALNNILTLDKDGELLLNDAELESGPGEVVVAYEEFNVLSPVNELSFNAVGFDDTSIIAYRIEYRNLQISTMGNDPGTILFRLSLMATLDGEVNPVSNANDYIQDYIQFDSTTSSGVWRLFNLNFSEISNTPPAVYVGTMTTGILGLVNPVKNISGDFLIENIPETSGENAIVSSSGFMTESSGTKRKYESYGFITSIDNPSESFRSFTLRANIIGSSPAPAGTGFTSGSIKVIGITKGGPAFT